MAYEKNPDELGALWNKFTVRGDPFMTGIMNGVNVVVFQNTKKNDNQPDWRVMKSKPKNAPAVPVRDEVPVPSDDDIGF